MSNTPPKPTVGRPFAKGTSGNPGGRKPIPDDVREALRALTPRALEVLKQLLESADEKVQVQAMREVLDRNLGKAVQPTDNVHSGSVGGLVVSFVKADGK